MRLTPLDIRHKEFRRGLRGYSEEEVDIFLDEVADEFERIFQENIGQRERLQRLEEQVSQYETIKETLQKTLISAQQQSDEMKSNARKEAELILKDAELKTRDILNESYADKQRIQQALIQLRQTEEDFRFKFRSLLEAHLKLLAEDEISEDRRQFRGLVSGVERELEQEGSRSGSEQAFRRLVQEDQTSTVDSTEAVGETAEAVGADMASPSSAADAAGTDGRAGAGQPDTESSIYEEFFGSPPPVDDGEPKPGNGGGSSVSTSEEEIRKESSIRRMLFGRKTGAESEEPEPDGSAGDEPGFRW